MAMGKRAPSGCQLSDLFHVLGESYVLDILHHILTQDKPVRFKDIQAALAISPNTLTERLKRLTATGMLSRKAFDEIPPRVEYSATAKAREFKSIFDDLDSWSRRNSLAQEQ